MGQVSRKLRRSKTAYHWHCPACDEMHPLPDDWEFDGNLDSPTFKPSFRHDWSGSRRQKICHYIVTAGRVAYCSDSTHALAGQTIDMPDLPPAYRDGPDCTWSDG